MVVSEGQISNIMGGMQQNTGIRLNNHKHKLRHRFDIVKKLGQGTYGKVQLAINKETGQDVAIKTIKKAKIETEKDLIRIRREIQIMSSVTHPHIIHIFEVFENRDKMVLVMEYAAGGELYDYLSEKKVLSESEARRIFRQVASACYYCHKHKICHRDLKLENILLDEYGNAKIADFGLSNVFDDNRQLSTYCGSPLYASPEIVRGTPYIGPEVDCWSLGVLLYTLVYGAMPFDGSNFKKLVKQITAGDFYEPQKQSTASELIHGLLTPAPQKRSSMVDVCGHWWVNQDEEVNCLEAAEELANQTPVRLDLLLSLAPHDPDKERVLAQPAEVIAPPPADKEPSQAQFGASDSLSLGSAMELEPTASSPAVLTTGAAAADQAEPPADKAAKRALEDEEEEKAKRKAEKARKRDGEKVAKKKKKPPKEPTVPEEDVSMGSVAESAEKQTVEKSEDQAAGDGEKAEDDAAVPEGRVPTEERPPSPVVTASQPGESQLELEHPQDKREEVEPTVDDFPAVEAPKLPDDVAKLPLAAETESGPQDEQTPNLEIASEGEVALEPTVQPGQTSSEEKEAKACPPVERTESITLSNNVPEEDIPMQKPGDGPVHTSSKISLKVVEPKPKETSKISPEHGTESKPTEPKAVSTSRDDSEKATAAAGPSESSEPKQSVQAPPKVEASAMGESEKVSGPKPKVKTGVPETPKEKSPARTAVAPSISPKKSKIPVIDTKSSEAQAKKIKAPQQPSITDAEADKKSQLSAKRPSISKSEESIRPVKKPIRSSSDEKEDVSAPTRKLTPAGEDGDISVTKVKDETAKPEEKVKGRTVQPADSTKGESAKTGEKTKDKVAKPDEKAKDKITKPEEKTKDKIMKPKEKATDKITKPADKSKDQPAKPDEKPKEKLVKPDEKTKDKPAKPTPSAKVPERRSPARSSAERVPSVSSVTTGVRPVPVDRTQSLPTHVPAAAAPAAAAARLSRVLSDETARPPPAARADDRAQSLPPRRAASKEYIIPIRLDDGEEVKPPTAPFAAPVSTPAPAAAAPSPTAPTPAPVSAPAPAQVRRPKPVSHTSSLRSLPEDSSSDDGGSGGGAADELAPPAHEPLRKSPREFIIPIALEGGGTMTPTVHAETNEQDRAEGSGLFRTHHPSGQRRLGSLLGDRKQRDGLWDTPLGLQRLSSMRCFDDRPLRDLGSWSSSRQRLSRPRMTSSTERADSLSSGGEEDDEDDQFEIFTAENLFGSLMDRVKNLTKRMDMDDNPAKRSLLLSDPLRMGHQLGSSQRGHHRMPDLWGMHGQVKSLFDKPMTFPHGSLFDQPPFSRQRVFQFYQHSSFGSQQAAESSDSGGSQQEDEPTTITTTGTTGTRHKTALKKTPSTPPKTHVTTVTFKIKPKGTH